MFVYHCDQENTLWGLQRNPLTTWQPRVQSPIHPLKSQYVVQSRPELVCLKVVKGYKPSQTQTKFESQPG